jgi:hypothetical protein
MYTRDEENGSGRRGGGGGEGGGIQGVQLTLLRQFYEQKKTSAGSTTEYTQSGNDHFRAYGTFRHDVMYTPAERADALPLFLLYPYMYSVCGTSKTHLLS